MPSYQMVNDSTLSSVIQNACALLSLPVPPDPAGTTDPNVTLMRTAMNLAALGLMNEYEWPELTKPGTITVSAPTPPPAGQTQELSYDLPEDFFRFIDQTQWNAPMAFPAVGPVSPQGWMTYTVFPISSNFTLTWQVREGKIWFLNPPTAPGQDFKFMYLSRAIVRDADNPDLYKNVATKNGDQFLLDGVLLLLLTRVRWLEAKGFDSSGAASEFSLAFDSRVSAKKGANILSMARDASAYPYIGVGNLPEASLYGMRQ